jgi:hypothetical protein
VTGYRSGLDLLGLLDLLLYLLLEGVDGLAGVG